MICNVAADGMCVVCRVPVPVGRSGNPVKRMCRGAPSPNALPVGSPAPVAPAGKPCGTCGPGVLRTAANAVAAAGRVVGAAVSGQPVGVSMDVRAQRMAICHACDRFSGNRCLECGCFVEAKAMLATEDCPLDRWARRDFANARRPLFLLTHGLGDSIQFTVALRHLRGRFDSIAVRVSDSVAPFFAGLVDRVYRLSDQLPVNARGVPWPIEHDYVEDCPWNVPAACYADSPSTKAEAWLRLRGIVPQADLCRYQSAPRPEAIDAARRYLRECDATGNAILIHHTGRTARNRKTLPDAAWLRVVERVREAGYVPIVLDWDCHGSPGATVGQFGSYTPGRGHWLWHGWDVADVERLAALAQEAVACVGIDSGPGHVFQASGTPTVICWARHHPLNFAPVSGSTLHLVPADHARWIKGFADPGRFLAAHKAGAFFAANYAHRVYTWDGLGDQIADAVLEQADAGRLRGADDVLQDTPSMRDADLRVNVGRGVAWQADATHVVPYDQAYMDKYREYAMTERGAAINAFRQEFAAHYARSVLDVGIGCGDFVGKWTGGPCYGNDVNPAGATWLRERGLFRDVTAETLRTVQAVTMWDVFEHFTQPSEVLKQFQPGQYLLLSLPIFDDLTRVRESRHYRPGEHLTYWTRAGLIRFLDAAGFTLLKESDAEIKAGREAIHSFAFRKRPFDPPARSILITGGIGDWFAVEQTLTGEERDALETVYYATRQHRPIAELWRLLPNYPRLREHVVLTDDWSKRFCFVDKWEVGQAIGRECPAERDGSIKLVFADLAKGAIQCRQSSVLRHTLTTDLPTLPEQYACVQYTSPNDRRHQRDVRDKERPAIQAWASLRGLPLVSIEQSEGFALPVAIEILKHASGFIGIDSCFSVLAARLFEPHTLKIRSVNRHLFSNVRNYYPTQEAGSWVSGSFA